MIRRYKKVFLLSLNINCTVRHKIMLTYIAENYIKYSSTQFCYGRFMVSSAARCSLLVTLFLVILMKQSSPVSGIIYVFVSWSVNYVQSLVFLSLKSVICCTFCMICRFYNSVSGLCHFLSSHEMFILKCLFLRLNVFSIPSKCFSCNNLSVLSVVESYVPSHYLYYSCLNKIVLVYVTFFCQHVFYHVGHCFLICNLHVRSVRPPQSFVLFLLLSHVQCLLLVKEIS